MQLLTSSATPVPEFVSVSLLIKPELADTVTSMAEPLMLPSPLACLSQTSSLEALRELHAHLTFSLKASALHGKTTADNKIELELLAADEKYSDAVQLFRPRSASGVALLYRLLRSDVATLTAFSQLALAHDTSSNSTASPSSSRFDLSRILGVVLCVAVTGLPFAHYLSPLSYSILHRMNECILVITKLGGPSDVAVAKSILTSFLLMDDDYEKTNQMAEASDTFIPPDDAGKGITSQVFSRRNSAKAGMGGDNQAESSGLPIVLNLNSAELARVLMQRLTVLSVAERDTFLRRFEITGRERKANLDLAGGGKSKFRRNRKGDSTRDADLEHFDFKGPESSTTTASSSSAAAATRGGGTSTSAVSTPSSSQQTRKAVTAIPEIGPATSTVGGSVSSGGTGAGSGSAMTGEPGGGKLQLKQSKKDTTKKGRRGSTMSVPASSSSSSHAGTASSSRQPRRSSHNTNISQQQQQQQYFLDDVSQSAKSHSGHDTGSVMSQTRVQVNIALNEDLSCSYKQSQLSSCTVEGVVQIQVKSSTQGIVPFHLLVRDPSGHVGAINENKKFADDVSSELVRDNEQDVADYKFLVRVLPADSYFPVLKYKCSPDLRPVPIRVQTRVKADGPICRVALQISSNPNNAASLTDLTIIMNVPDAILGETLSTQPPGGVWDDARQSVVWCVSELGDGEKFQLQARFEMERVLLVDNLRFPVAVRCQCLFAQLSDVELEVRDLPDVPAEMTMKVARRFRMSHREKTD